MADYHFVYKDVEGASTQWDDIQRKLGNLPEKPPAFKPAPFTPESDPNSIPKDKSFIDNLSHDDLEDLEDDPDLDDDRFLQEYRKKRLSQMQEEAKKIRYGSVVPISGSDFVREVSQAPSDVWVVVVLYKEGYTPEGVALVLCQSDPVLNDGQGGTDSREAVIEEVSRRFIEKVVTKHEDNDDGSSSD
ncbi:hypothetical protein ACFE04_007290 [Oxalis oulophora]